MRTAPVLTAAASVCGLGLMTAPGFAAEPVIVVDRPDVQRLHMIDEGFRTSDLHGVEVQGSAGKRIGEIEDFVLARGGYLYAVIDTADGPIEELTSLGDDETIVVPWDQLRYRSAQ